MSVINKQPFVEKVVGNGGSVDVIPTIPTAEGTYTLKVVISAQGIPTFSWILDS